MADLTDDQISFLRERLDKNNVSVNEDESGKIVAVKTKKKKTSNVKRRTEFLNRPMTWGFVFLFIGVAFDAFVMFSIWRVESALGAETLEWLADKDMGHEVRAAAKESGMEWLPQMVDLYTNRFEILLIGFGIPALIAVALFILDYYLTDKRLKASREDAEEDLTTTIKDLGDRT